MGTRTGTELGVFTTTQRRELLVSTETKPTSARDALIKDIAKLQAQIDVMEMERAKEQAEMIFIEIMILVFGLMVGFSIGRLW